MAPPSRQQPSSSNRQDEDDASHSPTRRQRTVYIPDDVWDRVRNASAYLSFFEIEGEPDSMSGLFERGLNTEVDRLEKTYNNGEPFRQRRART